MSFENKVIERQLQRDAWKLQNDSEKEIQKMKNALDRGNQESAKMYAMECIRKKEQAHHCEQTIARLNGIQSQLEEAKRSGIVQKSITNASKQLDKILSKTYDDNPKKIEKKLHQFQKQINLCKKREEKIDHIMFREDLECMDGETMKMKANQLLQQVSDQFQMEQNVLSSSIRLNNCGKNNNYGTDDLEERIQKLKLNIYH